VFAGSPDTCRTSLGLPWHSSQTRVRVCLWLSTLEWQLMSQVLHRKAASWTQKTRLGPWHTWHAGAGLMLLAKDARPDTYSIYSCNGLKLHW
jgi:hypothetical protein